MVIGQRVKRLEDYPLLTGRGGFAADQSRTGQLHARFVRSQVAHGRISEIETDQARARPGVVAVLTAADLPPSFPKIAPRQVGFDEMVPYLQSVLACDRVRYVGEPIAVVIATDAYEAEDAAEDVFVHIEELPVVVDPRVEPSAWDDLGHDTEVMLIDEAYGEVDDAFSTAACVVELELSVGRHSGVPMETRGTSAWTDPMTGTLHVGGAAKVPHYNRNALASMLGLDRDRIHLHEIHVGGGFGIRGELYPEDVVVAWAALRLGRPVKWIEDRQEHLIAANHSRDQVHVIKAAVGLDGVIHAIDDEFWQDQGAYVRTHGATVPTLTATLLPGPYRVPAYRVRGHIRLTNKTPAGTYRAPGRYEGSFVRERLVDVIAERLELDPAEVRRRNLIGHEEMPYSRPMSVLGSKIEYDSGQYVRMLDRVLEHVDYPTLRADVAQRRADGEHVGFGFGFFVEKSGLGPYEGVRASVDPDGALRIVTGAASVGQGVETTIAQIASEVLGIDYSSIRVSHGQTDELPYGFGAFASRVTVMTGSATHLAATEIREKALEIAAQMLEASPDDLELVDGRISVRGTPARSLTLGQVAADLDPSGARRHGTTPSLSAESWFHTDHMTYPYGLHFAVVHLDPETGHVAFERYVIAYDVGRAINPTLIEGQIVGGLAQGLGGALYEQFVYDDLAQPQATSFMDYLMPTLMEMPEVEVLLSEDAPSPLNPLGVKGAGEGGTTGAGAAIAGAISDALGSAEIIHSIPVVPATIWATLNDA
jgi:aerobic carbon-monoxide dehydrogenase large subunit